MQINRRRSLSGLFGTALIAGLMPDTVSAEPPSGKELVVYLTRSGNTRVLAGALARQRAASLFEIRTVTPYPEDYEAHVQLANRQRLDGVLPPLAEKIRDIEFFETVFLAFPIWAEALPAPIRTFLTTHDLRGRTIVPIVTHGGFGPGTSLETVRDMTPNARHLQPFILECDQERRQLGQLADWFATIEAGLPG